MFNIQQELTYIKLKTTFNGLIGLDNKLIGVVN